jgi:hypothetical protein
LVLFTLICTGNCDSSVGIVMKLLAGRPKNRDLITGRENFLFSSRMNRQDMASLSHISNVYWGGFPPEIEWAGSDVGHSQTSGVEVRNNFICTSTTKRDFLSWIGTTLSLIHFCACFPLSPHLKFLLLVLYHFSNLLLISISEKCMLFSFKSCCCCCCCFGGGAYQHCSHEGLLYSNPPMEFRHSSPEALHTKRRERPLIAKDGTKERKFS